jgi:hypothetical protein
MLSKAPILGITSTTTASDAWPRHSEGVESVDAAIEEAKGKKKSDRGVVFIIMVFHTHTHMVSIARSTPFLIILLLTKVWLSQQAVPCRAPRSIDGADKGPNTALQDRPSMMPPDYVGESHYPLS